MTESEAASRSAVAIANPAALKRLGIALVAVVITSGALAPPTQAHNCAKERPYCNDFRDLRRQSGRQEIISRVLGHHCFPEYEHDDPRRDDREIYSRIGVVFSDVTQREGFLETITIYFEGQERQVVGKLNAYGKRNDFNHYDTTLRDPGGSESFRVGKRVEFSRHGVYSIQHEPPQAGTRPGFPRWTSRTRRSARASTT